MDRKGFIVILITLTFFISCTLTVFNHMRDSLKVNINTCSKESLVLLPGIGPTLAQRIIDGRPYGDIWELDKIKGIGQDTIKSIEREVSVK